MLASLRKHIDREDEGFTLIELMVVVLIIAILLAIAIPTFLGARERAQNRAAQSDIRNALAAEKVYYTDAELYTSNTSAIDSIEPSLDYIAMTAGTTTQVGLTVSGNGNTVCIGKESKSGDHYSLIEVATGPGAGTYYDDQNCAATVSDVATATPP